MARICMFLAGVGCMLLLVLSFATAAEVNMSSATTATKRLYPSLEEFKIRQAEEVTPSAAQESSFIYTPFKVIDRRETHVLKERPGLFLRQLWQNYPSLAKTVYKIAGWKPEFFPEDESQTRMFSDTLNTAGALLGNAAEWVYKSVPEVDRKSIYSSFYQTFRKKLPNAFFEAVERVNPAIGRFFSGKTSTSGETGETSTLPEARTAHEPQLHATGEAGHDIHSIQPLPASGITPAEHIPWKKIQNSISKAHGPLTQLPQWVPASGTCVLGDGQKLIDVVKTTSDVLFRLTLLIVQQIKRKNFKKEKLDADQTLVALCASAGAFIAGWQQHQQAFGQEDQNTPKAHALLIERLRHVDKYLLKTYDETTGNSNHKEWKKSKAEIAAIGKSSMMSTCVKYMKEAGDVATKPFTDGTLKYPSLSLYGGIANTVKAKFSDSEVVARAVHEYAKQSSDPGKLVGLCGALQTSGYFKKCFCESNHMYSATAFHLHVEGTAVLRRSLARDRPIGKHALAQAMCNPDLSGKYFESAFRLLSAAVTPEWEHENLFAKLSSWTGVPVILAPALEDSVPVPVAQPESAWDPALDDGIYRISHEPSSDSKPSGGTLLYVGGLPQNVRPTEVHVQGFATPVSSRPAAVHDVQSDSTTLTASTDPSTPKMYASETSPPSPGSPAAGVNGNQATSAQAAAENRDPQVAPPLSRNQLEL